MKELVVGFDGSDLSHAALRWAAGLAGALGTRTAVLQAWSGGNPATADQEGDEVKRALAEAAIVVLGDQAANQDIEFEARPGFAAGTILERVTPDSGLVLGSRGRGGFAGLLLGSVSRECVEHAPCPVMVIRHERALPNASAPILVGHDGSPSSARALHWASDLAQSMVNLGQRLDAGLLVVGRRGKGTVRALRIGSVASYLVTSTAIPIAIIPPAPGAEVS